ncbi:MAG: TetR/AcrR family transcriptional regulator [Oricola sp.]
MTVIDTENTARKRAPSRRSLETRSRILDNAERLFARDGYEGASIRDIAAAAEVPVALVNFHGGAKEELFFTIVARRAEILADRRVKALGRAKASGKGLTPGAVLDCFIRPYLDLAASGGEQWTAYARLIAYVSADERWRPISRRCFDPTAKLFMDELAALFPKADPQRVAGAFVFAISAMLALATSRWRIEALAGGKPGSAPVPGEWADFLISFCESGFRSALANETA